MIENDPFRNSVEKYSACENLDLRGIKKDSKILIQTKNNTYTFEVEEPAKGGQWARGKIKGGIFADEERPLAARIHGSIVKGSSSLHSNKIDKGLSLEFSVLKDEIEVKKLPIKISKTQSMWETVTTSPIKDVEVIPPEQEITPEDIISE